jgi:hypothetical protein
MVVLGRVELVWFDFGFVLHLFWALICLVVGLLPLWLTSGICIVVFLIYFRYFSCVISKCPPAKDQTSGLVEIVSSKALFLRLVFVC